jgi:hypothetical protein
LLKFWAWLANSPYASIIKIAVGGALAAVLAAITNADGSPVDNSVWVILGAALIPYILHLINPVSRAQYAAYRGVSKAADVVEKAEKNA